MTGPRTPHFHPRRTLTARRPAGLGSPSLSPALTVGQLVNAAYRVAGQGALEMPVQQAIREAMR